MVSKAGPLDKHPLSLPGRLPHLDPAWATGGGPAYTVGIVAATPRPADLLLQLVEHEPLAFRVAEGDDLITRLAHPGDVHLVLLDLTEDRGETSTREGAGVALDSPLPLIVAVPEWALGVQGPWLQADDLIVCPWSRGELAVRARRLMERRAQIPLDTPGVIRSGALVIDTNRYDVLVSGRTVLLTFKEYELLKLLASYPGRVFSRETLLEQVWGYEYFGGTRTVDVHVRRLRSKIEDATHTFVDTVWNVGYRFRAG